MSSSVVVHRRSLNQRNALCVVLVQHIGQASTSDTRVPQKLEIVAWNYTIRPRNSSSDI